MSKIDFQSNGHFGINGIIIHPGSDVDADLVKIDVTGTPTLIWDESTSSFKVNAGFVIRPATDSVTAVQILDSDGGTPIFVVDTVNENVGIGTLPDSEAGFNLRVEHSLKLSRDGGGSQVWVESYHTSASAKPVWLTKRAGGTRATPLAIANAWDIGAFEFYGYDGNDFNNLAAKILVEVDGAVATNKIPARIVFGVTPVGGTTPTEVLNLASSLRVAIGRDPPLARFDIVGRVDEIQLIVQAHSTQVINNLVEFQDGDGNVLVNVLGAGNFQTRKGRIRNTTRATTTYTILVSDDIIFANTDGATWTATLPAGVEGQTFKIINSGSSKNNLTVAPNGSEHLLGVNSNFELADAETLIITYNGTDGWY